MDNKNELINSYKTLIEAIKKAPTIKGLFGENKLLIDGIFHHLNLAIKLINEYEDFISKTNQEINDDDSDIQIEELENKIEKLEKKIKIKKMRFIN